MKLGIFIDSNKIYVSECKSKRYFEVLNNYNINYDKKIDNDISNKIRELNRYKKYKKLNILLSSSFFKIQYFDIDERRVDKNIKNLNIRISNHFDEKELMTRTFNMKQLNNNMAIVFGLKKELVNDFLRLSRNLKLKPNLLSPYFFMLDNMYRITSKIIKKDLIVIVYFDQMHIDIVFIELNKIKFFKKIEKSSEKIEIDIIEIIRFYNLNYTIKEVEKVYYYGKYTKDNIESIKLESIRLGMTLNIMEININCDKNYLNSHINSIISAMY